MACAGTKWPDVPGADGGVHGVGKEGLAVRRDGEGGDYVGVAAEGVRNGPFTEIPDLDEQIPSAIDFSPVSGLVRF